MRSYTLALVGLPAPEALTLETFLRQLVRPLPGYRVQDEVMDAQLLIVDADNPQALYLVRHAGLPARVLLVGQTDGGTGWPLQPRPMRLTAVLAELDRLVGLPLASASIASAPGTRTGFAATERAASASPTAWAPDVQRGRRSRDSEFLPTQPMGSTGVPAPGRLADASAFLQHPGVIRMTDLGALNDAVQPLPRTLPTRRSSDPPSVLGSPPTAQVPEPARADVLLVAQSLEDGRALLKRFERYGLSVAWSHEPEQALVMLKLHPYRLVVIDRLSGQPDALDVCRAAKQNQHHERSPVVFVFAAMAGNMDRMKAGLAGCDAYLSRSVAEVDLYKLLAQQRLVNLNAFARTQIGI